jgi:hypothetical protein
MDKGARPLHQPAVAFPPSLTRRTCLLGVSSLCLYRLSHNQCLKLLPVPDVSQYMSLPTSAYRVARSECFKLLPTPAYWVSQMSAYTGCVTISVSNFCPYRIFHSICVCPRLSTGCLTISVSNFCPYRMSHSICLCPRLPTGWLTVSVSNLCPHLSTGCPKCLPLPGVSQLVLQTSARTGYFTVHVSAYVCLPGGSQPVPQFPAHACLPSVSVYLKYLPLPSYRVSHSECLKSLPTPAYWVSQVSTHTGCLTIIVSSVCPYHATVCHINSQIPVRIEFSRQRYVRPGVLSCATV